MHYRNSCIDLLWLDFCSIRESSIKNVWNVKNAIFMGIMCYLALDDVKLTHTGADQSKSGMLIFDSMLMPFMHR